MSASQARLSQEEFQEAFYYPSVKPLPTSLNRRSAQRPVQSPGLRPGARRVHSSFVKKGLPTSIYWMALVTMVFCVFQCVRTILVETYTMAARVKSQPIIERYYQETRQENRILQERIKNSSTRQGIEAMARNYLNLTGDGEILVRLH